MLCCIIEHIGTAIILKEHEKKKIFAIAMEEMHNAQTTYLWKCENAWCIIIVWWNKNCWQFFFLGFNVHLKPSFSDEKPIWFLGRCYHFKNTGIYHFLVSMLSSLNVYFTNYCHVSLLLMNFLNNLRWHLFMYNYIVYNQQI